MKDMGFCNALRSGVRGWTATTALLSGATTPGIAALAAGTTASLTVIEPDGDRLRRAMAEAGADRCRAAHGALGDFRTDPAVANAILADVRPRDLASLDAARRAIAARADADPLVAPDSQDLVILDLSVNRGYPDEVAATLDDSFRVLRKGGRLVMAVLLADEPVSCVPPVVVGDLTVHTLPLETEIAAALDRTGFHGIDYLWCNDAEPAVLGTVEVRAFLVVAFKGKQGPCLEQGHAVIYRGPFRETWDDDGHHFIRGERAAVCAKTYGILMRAPYEGLFIGLPSRGAPPLEEAPPYDCGTPRRRDPRVTKGLIAPGCPDREGDRDGSVPSPRGSGCC